MCVCRLVFINKGSGFAMELLMCVVYTQLHWWRWGRDEQNVLSFFRSAVSKFSPRHYDFIW